uniref:Uncharacterized protein n=1 Tax=Ditylenchus dipsaci TaxID=166011 RepID=A0A915EMZ0_9BILA
MGANVCKGEKVLDEATNNHKRIELELKKDKAEEKKSSKYFCLELINYRYMIHTNYIIIYHYIVKGIIALKMDIPDDEKQIIKIINQISSCVCVSEACKRLNDFYVPDNTTYLFAESDRILQPQYKPTEKDVLHARASTTGVHEITFAFRKFGIRLIDVGGQKTERRKWIHCFENVTAILFVVSLSCYDQYMEEDPTKNRMEDSVDLFNSMYKNGFLHKCSFILFLNKKDLFEEKLKHVPLSKFLPQYTGDNNYDSALEFLQRLYLDCQNDDARHIYNHVTNATDTKNVQFVFGAACDIILQNNLTRAGMT